MNVLVVDDEALILDDTVSILKEIYMVDEVYAYTDPYEALEAVKEKDIQVAILDVKMYGIHGIELAKRMKEIIPHMYIVFLTGYTDYMRDAFSIHARGYLMKPPVKEELENEIIFANEEISPTMKNNHRIRVQTFGNFEVFCDGHPIDFISDKSKELLAYLVDRRGAEISMSELADVLWEDSANDKNAKSYVRRAISKLLEVLKENQCEEMVCKSRNRIYVLPEAFDCDYYNFINGNVFAINSFSGEYMTNYSWAEFTTGFLDSKTYKEGYIG